MIKTDSGIPVVNSAPSVAPEPCPLCGNRTTQVLALRLRRGHGIVLHCGKCDHGFLVPEERIDGRAYYSEAYWQEVSHYASGSGTDAAEQFRVYTRYQGERMPLIAPHLSPFTRLLEVGAGAGQFLAHVKDRVAVADAIELDRSCCSFIRDTLGLRADSELLRESVFKMEKYDVVCSFQVMEHVEFPVAFLRDLRESMKEGATAFVEVPNLRDPLLAVWDIDSYRTFYYHSSHLHYFTEKSLRKVAADAGFSPAHMQVHFTQDYHLLNHLNWIMNDAPQATCEAGLSEITIAGHDAEISGWLTGRLRDLNRDYVAKLAEAKATSNLMLVVSNGPPARPA